MMRQASDERKLRTKTNQGFSLIELLMVVAIMLIIAAIAIPNFIKSKMRSNEASAVATLRALNTAAVSYSTSYGYFPSSLSDLGPSTAPTSTAADLIDSAIMSGTKSGYVFTFVGAGSPVTTYTATAAPIAYNSTGIRTFFMNETGIIRESSVNGSPADVSSTPIS